VHPKVVVAMHAELVGLPAFGVDVHGAFDNLDSVIAELTRAPKRDDPPDVTQLLIDNRAVFSKFRDLYHSCPYFDKIDYCERLINYLVAYACKVIRHALLSDICLLCPMP
jgi:hypothetical protein